MCIAFKAKVVSARGRQITVRAGNRTIKVGRAVDAKKGDFVLVQQGLAVEKLAKGRA